ncbi:testis-specific chromodomain protein Y 1-like isoform X2 [Paramacrobiotus metropolitanus]|uniref:testis-specific chromodomain protein Y 1-like isoform X2 n=1 Tax=Paramacrobiotus metropolitanus TaxID=2943436 RepID=UPI002445BFFF|nr:testis-specific chromodomain protein Y 1-like isoform X2 [Paramacrobiotus metropolitanus]
MPPTRRKSVTAKDDGEGLYEVKAIVDKRIIQDDVVQYRVQWKDKKFQGRDTWETRENLVDGCEIMLSKFEERLQKRREKLTKRQIAQQLKKDHLKTKKRQREQSVTAVPVENSSLSDTRARKRRAAKKKQPKPLNRICVGIKNLPYPSHPNLKYFAVKCHPGLKYFAVKVANSMLITRQPLSSICAVQHTLQSQRLAR